MHKSSCGCTIGRWLFSQRLLVDCLLQPRAVFVIFGLPFALQFFEFRLLFTCHSACVQPGGFSSGIFSLIGFTESLVWCHIVFWEQMSIYTDRGISQIVE